MNHSFNTVKHLLATPLSQIIVKTELIKNISDTPNEVLNLNNEIKDLVDNIFKIIENHDSDSVRNI
jgi:hypothetical protein